MASSPTRTIAGLYAFTKKIILIAGGYDKKIPYDVMGKAINDKVKCLILIGQTGKMIEASYKNEMKKLGTDKYIPIFKSDSLENATNLAFLNAIEDDIIILSPADMFKDFAHRGNKFKEIVFNILNS